MDKPLKKILVSKSKIFYFDYASKKVSLDYFMNWCKESVPKGSQDVTIEIIEDWSYDDCYVDSCSINLVLAWKEKANNPRYARELKKYNKQLKNRK